MSNDDRSQEFTAVLGFFIAVCTILVLLRCYCKIVIVKSFSADDYSSVLTLVAFLVYCSLALSGVQNGTGKRRYLIPDDKYPDGMKYWWSCEPTYVFTGIALKLSIGIFLLRIAVERSHRIILWISILVIQLYSVFFLLLFTFQCWPISFFWERFRGGTGHCIHPSIVVNSFYGYSALSCVTDWIFSIVPIFIVQKLQMDRQKKITVGIILGFCAIGSTATIIRLPYIRGLNDEADFLYSTIDVAIWSTCETGIGLAASAAATLRPLLREFFNPMSLSGSASRKNSRNWTGKYPSRSGYLHHSSEGNTNDIALKDHTSSFAGVDITVQTHQVNGDNSSLSGSTAGLRDWDHNEKESGDKYSAESALSNGGIRKTVKITQC